MQAIRRRVDPNAIDRAAQALQSHRAGQGNWRAFDASDVYHYGTGKGCSLEDVQRAAGHNEPDPTKLYDRRGYNTEKSAGFHVKTRYLGKHQML